MKSVISGQTDCCTDSVGPGDKLQWTLGLDHVYLMGLHMFRNGGDSFWLLALTAVLCLHNRSCDGSTLYQWLVDSQTRFNYDPNPNNMLGVYNWPQTYPAECGGPHQSPVDIQTDRVRYNSRSCSCPRLMFHSPTLRGSFKNNGHSPEFEPGQEEDLMVTNIPHRPGLYKMHDFHLHYGGVTGRGFELQGLRFRGSGVMSAGSEHTVDGLRFEGELHVVLYNSRYPNLEMADDKEDGVAVIVFFIQKIPGSTGASSDPRQTSAFSEFLERNIPEVSAYQSSIMTEVDLNMFFDRQCQFYTYAGSTTTPPCHQSVRWIIMKDPLMVTERAWFRLTGLQSRGDFNSRFGNYRTTQPLNDRVVEANFMPENGPVRPSPDAEIIAMMARPNMLMLPSPDAPRSAMMAARMTDVNPGNVTADAAGVSSMATMASGGAAPPMTMGGILRSSMPIPSGRPMSAMMMMTPAFNANVGRVIQDFMMRPRGSQGTGPGVMSSGQGMSGMMPPMEAMGSGMPQMMLRTFG